MGTINFVVDGEVYYTLEFKGNVPTLPANPSKSGYKFVGWFIDDDFAAEQLDVNAVIGASITVYAQWVPAYTLIFECNGGNEVASIVEEGGLTITMPAAPVKEGFTFRGWYTDNDTFNNEYAFSLMPQNDFTLYAKWVDCSKCNIETAANYTIEDSALSLTVGNAVIEYDFSNTIITSEESEWSQLASDGETIIPSKTVSL